MSKQLLLAFYHALLHEGIPLYSVQECHPQFSGLQCYIFSHFKWFIFHDFSIKPLSLLDSVYSA